MRPTYGFIGIDHIVRDTRAPELGLDDGVILAVKCKFYTRPKGDALANWAPLYTAGKSSIYHLLRSCDGRAHLLSRPGWLR